MTTLPQGAPESILDRCNFIRVNGMEREALTDEIKDQILGLVRKYGTGTFSQHSASTWYGRLVQP